MSARVILTTAIILILSSCGGSSGGDNAGSMATGGENSDGESTSGESTSGQDAGGENNTGKQNNSDTGTSEEGNGAGSEGSSNAIALTNGELLDPLNCHEQRYSLLDAESDVMFDLPSFPVLKSIRDNLLSEAENAGNLSTEETVQIFRRNNALVALDLIALAAFTPITYTLICNHEKYLENQCAFPGTTNTMSLNGSVLSGNIIFSDGSLVDLTINDALARSGAYRFTDAEDASVQEGSGRREEGGKEMNVVLAFFKKMLTVQARLRIIF